MERIEQFITVHQALERLGLSREQLVNAIWHGRLIGRKNGQREYIYVLASSVEEYRQAHDTAIPAGYITIDQAMNLTGWSRKQIYYRIVTGKWRGLKRCKKGALVWYAVSEDDLHRDLRFRCKRCDILLEPEEAGPLCSWCECGGTDCANDDTAASGFSSGKKT